MDVDDSAFLQTKNAYPDEVHRPTWCVFTPDGTTPPSLEMGNMLFLSPDDPMGTPPRIVPARNVFYEQSDSALIGQRDRERAERWMMYFMRIMLLTTKHHSEHGYNYLCRVFRFRGGTHNLNGATTQLR